MFGGGKFVLCIFICVVCCLYGLVDVGGIVMGDGFEGLVIGGIDDGDVFVGGGGDLVIVDEVLFYGSVVFGGG